MKARCDYPGNTSYARYGGRGIKYCPEWTEFDVFQAWALANGYDDQLTLDRIDSNGNYEPENCRWADALTQSRNRAFCKKNEAGEAWSAIAAAHGIPTAILNNRISAGGWEPEIAATWPLGKKRAARRRNDKGQYAREPATWRR